MKENRKNSTNVPNLRFPEFSEAWDEKKLAQVTSKIGSGKTPKGGEEVYTSEGIPFIRSQNVINNSLVLDSTHIPQNIHETMNGSKVYPNDILLNITGGSIGRSCVVPKDFTEGNVNQHVSIIRLKNENPKFLQSILSSWRGQKLVFQGMTGSGREGLNFESIKNFKINFPSLKEQNKIASLLTVLDDRIQTQNKIIEYQESLMKSLMQQIFTQQLRFKDDNGSDFPDWEEKKIGDILQIGSGRDYKHLEQGSIPVYGTGGYMTSVNDYIHEGESVGIGRKGTIDKPVFLTGKFWTVDTLFYTHSFKNVSPYFVFLLFKQINWLKNNEASGVPSLSKTTIEKIKVKIPVIEEQQKITNFLSSLDAKLEKEKQILKQYQQQKKYLLQNLFI